MKRRAFIFTASVVAVGLPVAYYIKKSRSEINPLTTSDFLSRFCDEQTIRDIGIKYRSIVPSENEKQKLTDLILTDLNGEKIKSSNRSGVANLVAKKNHEEFSAFQTIILQGWVISITEARQCALFSLS